MPTQNPRSVFSRTLQVLFTFVASVFLVASAIAADATKSYSIESGPAATTLKQFAEQSGRSVLFSTEKVQGISTNAISGELTTEEALDRLLSGTRLSAVPEKSTGGFAIRREVSVEVAEKNDSSRPANRRAADNVQDGVVKLDTFEVFGRKTLNMDIARTRDDSQPYVTFGRAEIDASGASTLEDFFRSRLPMDSANTNESQGGTSFGGRSTVNLRGLGTNQTLILIDGRRMAGGVYLNQSLQPDLNGIPLSAIERIEILPATASGIYGGSATGGVINVIMRRDYSGIEVKATYDNTFDTDSARRRIDFSGGYTLNGGNTNVLFSGSYSSSNMLALQDRASLRAANIARAVAIYPQYGSDKRLSGNQPNIFVYSGSLLLKDNTPLGSLFATIPAGYRGYAVDGGSPLVANAGKWNTGLDPESGQSAVANAITSYSFSATLRHRFSDKFQVYAEARQTVNESRNGSSHILNTFSVPAANPNNPFNQNVSVTVPVVSSFDDFTARSSQRTLATGVVASLPHDWKLNVDLSHAQSYTSSATSYLSNALSAAVAAGTLNPFRDTQRDPINIDAYLIREPRQESTPDRLSTGAVRAGGPLWTLPGGPLMLSTLIERREESVPPSFYSYQGRRTYTGKQADYVSSGYLELRVPIVGAKSALPFVNELELQVAGRRDNYRTTGSSLAASPGATLRSDASFSSQNPTLGMRWVVTPDLAVRGSWGTGFLPPASRQLVNTPVTWGSMDLIGSFGYKDPKRGNTPLSGPGLMTQGGTPGLKPEKSDSKSAGIVLTPRFLPGFRLSVDWVKITKKDNITTLWDWQQYIGLEDSIPGIVTRSPTPTGGYSVGPITSFYTGPINIASSEVEAYDLQLDYSWKTATLGAFDFTAIGTRTAHYKMQTLATDPVVDYVGFGGVNTGLASDNSSVSWPLKWKATLNLTWRRGSWSAGWTARYTDSYYVDPTYLTPGVLQAQGNGGKIDAVWYHDLFVGYRLGSASGADESGWRRGLMHLLSNTEWQLGVRNVFNTAPPYNAFNSTTLTSEYGDLRLASYYLSVKKTF